MIKKLFFLIFLSFYLSFFGQVSDVKKATTQKDITETVTLVSAFPNPFSQKTKISFTSTKDQSIVFEVKNVLGISVIKMNIDAVLGKNNINFYQNDLPTGMYLYSLQTDTETISKRLVLR